MNSTAILSRREAIRRLGGGAAAAAAINTLGSRLTAADTAAGLNGRINHSVCKWCYPKLSVEELCQAAKSIGLSSIDLVGPTEWPTLKKYGLTCAMANGADTGIREGWNRVENHANLIERYMRVIPQAADAGLTNLICLSGLRRGMSDEEGLKNCASGLKQIMAPAEKHRVTIVLEMLNSKVNHKDYMADTSTWAVELVQRVGSERFKLLYDIYHMQIMEGDVIATIRKHHQHFAHYHTGGVPGRHEIDDTQELNYPAIMKAIVATGFRGHVAQEFLPTRAEPLSSLKDAVRICDV